MTTAIRTDLWLEGVAMTPARQRAYDVMQQYDEGLTGRAFRAILQIGDNDPRLRPADAVWLWDDEMGETPVEWLGISAGWRLTAFGQRLYDAINAGDAGTIIRLTTDKTFGEWLN
jgi:hypothetical protein